MIIDYRVDSDIGVSPPAVVPDQGLPFRQTGIILKKGASAWFM